MIRILTRSRTAALLGCLIFSVATATAADRPAPQILRDLDAIQKPSFDPSRQSDPGYMDQIRKEVMESAARRDALTFELFGSDPNHERLPELMRDHWRRLPPVGAAAAKLDQEITTVLARTRNDQLKAEAHFARAQAGLFKTQQTGSSDLAGVEEFVQRFPKDPRSEQLLYFAWMVSPKPEAKRSYEERLIREYPNSKLADAILGSRRQLAAIGKPFDLEFTDAITGSPVSMKALKGKVVVIDFWATWCGPCVAAMPHMKELYAKYHGQSVEFIGVSLDKPKEEGGLDRLKSFVKEHEIRWPQYYMGNAWDSEFSKSWGINAIPAVFVVDTQGNLYSVAAHGKLDEMIPELLAKKGEAARRPAGGG
jgi:thiol-disulfide isomerase/thioredoxin